MRRFVAKTGTVFRHAENPYASCRNSARSFIFQRSTFAPENFGICTI